MKIRLEVDHEKVTTPTATKKINHSKREKGKKELDKKRLQYLTTAVFVQSLLDYFVSREEDHTCHILKGECGWCIAPRVTLLVSHPGFI